MSAAPARARDDELDARVATAMEHVAAVLSAPASAALPKVADFHTAHREVEDALRAVVEELRDGHPGPRRPLVDPDRAAPGPARAGRAAAGAAPGGARAGARGARPAARAGARQRDPAPRRRRAERQLRPRPRAAEPGQGRALLPVHAHFRDDPAGAERAVEALRESPLALEYPVIETELMRRRRATIVRNAGSNPRVPRPPIPVDGGPLVRRGPDRPRRRGDRLLPRRLRRSPRRVARARRGVGVRGRLRPGVRARRAAPARARAAAPAARARGVDRRDGRRAVRGRDRAGGRAASRPAPRCARRRSRPPTPTRRA